MNMLFFVFVFCFLFFGVVVDETDTRRVHG